MAKLNLDVSGGETASPAAAAPQAQQQAVPIDATHARTAYSNFCRVTGTPEELIIEFGLNAQPQPVPTEPIQIAERIVLNYYTAKRLLGALHMSVQRHESAFGTLETDVQKRVRPTAPRV
ncbi:MAG TPA: DUF3467 domain-containing protein [Pirellulales bacterium]|nr:DUF3467 domain-containing protein [Pirellulales bacterium]